MRESTKIGQRCGREKERTRKSLGQVSNDRTRTLAFPVSLKRRRATRMRVASLLEGQRPTTQFVQGHLKD